MRTFRKLFMLLAMLFCSFATFANYYYCEVLTGSKVIEVGNPRYTPDNGQPTTTQRTVAKRSYLSLTPYTLTDDINNARLCKEDSPSEVEKLVKDEGDYFYSLLSEEKNKVNRINEELKAKTFAYIDANRNKTQNIDNAKNFIGTKKTNQDSLKWSPMYPLDFVGNAKNYHYKIINTSNLIKFKNNDRYLNDRGRFTRKESAKVFETYEDVKNAYQNCEMKDECEVVRNL